MRSTTSSVQWCQAAQQQLTTAETLEETNQDLINNLTQLEYLIEKENVKSGNFMKFFKFNLKEFSPIENIAGGFTNMDYRLKI